MTRLVDYVVLVGFDFNQKSAEGQGRILQRFPSKSWVDYPYDFNLESFCQPCGWSLKTTRSPPTFFVAYLTDVSGKPYFAACLTFHEAVSPHSVVGAIKVDGISVTNGHLRLPFSRGSLTSSSIHSSESLLSHSIVLPQRWGVAHDPVATSIGKEYVDPNLVRPAEVYAPKCLVLLSRHQHFDVLKKCLSILYTVFADSLTRYSLEQMIANLLTSVDVPLTGGPRMSFSLGTGDRLVIQPPSCDTIPVTHDCVAHLFRYLGVHNVILLFTAILSDQKIVLCSRSLNRLTQSCHALVTILYPLKYGHTYVPIMPKSLVEYLNAPTPFLYGIHASYMNCLPDLTDVLVADLDGGSVTCPDSVRVPSLPSPYCEEVVESLFKILNPELCTADHLYPPNTESRARDPIILDKELRAVFLKLFATLFSGYRSCLNITRIHPHPVLHFNQSMFLMLRRIPQHNEFFERLLSSMRFQQFILERGPPFRVCDLFDEVYHASVPPSETLTGSSTNLCTYEESPACGSEILTLKCLGQKLLNNECGDGPVEQILPNEATEAHKRLHSNPFPTLDSDLVDRLIAEALERNKKRNVLVVIPEPRLVPQGFLLDRNPFKADMFSEKSRVLREFVADIFNNHITEALKRRNTIRQDLKSRPIRRLFVDELQRYITSSSRTTPLKETASDINMHDKRNILMWEQFELIVDLLDEALCQESQSEESGIASVVMDLSTRLCTEINNVRYYANMTNQIQRHAVWGHTEFWENMFNEHVNSQIRSLYVHFSEEETKQKKSINRGSSRTSGLIAEDRQRSPIVLNKRSRFHTDLHQKSTFEAEHSIGVDSHYSFEPHYTSTASALEIAADEMRLGRTRAKEVLNELEKLEESTVYAQIIHFVNLIVNFRIPVEFGAIAASNYGESRSGSECPASQQKVNGCHRSADIEPGHVNQSKRLAHSADVIGYTSSSNHHPDYARSGKPSPSDALQYILHIEVWIRRFVEKVIDQNALPTERVGTFGRKIKDIIEGHLLNLESIHPEVKNLPKSKKPEVANPSLFTWEIPIPVNGYDCVRCQLLVDGRSEQTDWQNFDTTNEVYNTTKSTALNDRLQSAELEVDADCMIPSLLPAQGALFLTNYRVIFTGYSRDPYQSNKAIVRSFPVSSLHSVKKLGITRISTIFPIIGSSASATARSAVTKEAKRHGKRGQLGIDVAGRKGLVRIDESLDVIAFRTLTFELLKLGFDPDEVTQDTRDELRLLLLNLRYPHTLQLNFNSVPNSATISPPSNSRTSSNNLYSLDSPATSINATDSGLLDFNSLHNRTLSRGSSMRSFDPGAELCGPESINSERDPSEVLIAFLSNLGLGTIDSNLRQFIPTSPGYMDMVRFVVNPTSSLTDRSSVCTHGSSQWSYTNARLVAYNSCHDLCKSYPALLIIPQTINRACLLKVSRAYRRGRFPVITWQHPVNGAYLLRGSSFQSKSLIGALKHTGSTTTASAGQLFDKDDSEDSGELTSTSASVSKEHTRYLQALVELSLTALTAGGNFSTCPSTHLCGQVTLPPLGKVADGHSGFQQAHMNTPGSSASHNLDGKTHSLGRLSGLSKSNKDGLPQFANSIQARPECHVSGTITAARLIAHQRSAESDRKSPTFYLLGEKHMVKTCSKNSSLKAVNLVPVDSPIPAAVAASFKKLLKACLPLEVPQASQYSGILASVANAAGFIPHTPQAINGVQDSLSSNSGVSTSQVRMGSTTVQTEVCASGWLQQLQSLFEVAGIVVDLIDLQGSTVAVCLEDGIDFTTQVVTLSQVMMDPHYRSIAGFWSLIEKEWLIFGHRYAHRLRQTASTKSDALAPVFLQFLDAVHQLLRQFPCSFEFNDFFLQFLAYHHLSNRFRDFKYDCESERLVSWFSTDEASETTVKLPAFWELTSIWSFIERQHWEWPIFFNFRYCHTLSERVLRPSTNLASLDIWSFYLEENLATGPVYDLDHFSPSYRKQNSKPYEPILRHGLNNTHVEQVYAVLGLREGEEVSGWQSLWARAASEIMGSRYHIPTPSRPRKLCRTVKCKDNLRSAGIQLRKSTAWGGYRESSEPLSSMTLSKTLHTHVDKVSHEHERTVKATVPESHRIVSADEEYKAQSSIDQVDHLSLDNNPLCYPETNELNTIIHQSSSNLSVESDFPYSSDGTSKFSGNIDLEDRFHYPGSFNVEVVESEDSSDECNATRSAILDYHRQATINRLNRHTLGIPSTGIAPQSDSHIDIEIDRSNSRDGGPSITSKLEVTSQHQFMRVDVRQSSLRCTHCNNLILTMGLGHRALECYSCRALVHDKCADLIPGTCSKQKHSVTKNGNTLPTVPSQDMPQIGNLVPSSSGPRFRLGTALSPLPPWRNGRDAITCTNATGSFLSVREGRSRRSSHSVSESTQSDQNCQTGFRQGLGSAHSGMLYKLGHRKILQQWKRRFFVLDTTRHELRYYENYEDLVPRGIIDLQEVRSVKIVKNIPVHSRRIHDREIFELETGSRTFRFAADSSEEAVEWVDQIQNTIQ